MHFPIRHSCTGRRERSLRIHSEQLTWENLTEHDCGQMVEILYGLLLSLSLGLFIELPFSPQPPNAFVRLSIKYVFVMEAAHGAGI